ncbi:MAG: SulP family inorganic anion transporter [Cytophagaceae bacterium]|jgi:MFS superfamily sulfate permease-like transporter|nr:SulP family inorganic anion transporter [Cytophagaceae bacterium]
MRNNEERFYETELTIEPSAYKPLGSILNPSASFHSLQKFYTHDLLSGFIVALITLPLSIGIATASGFPPISGIYTALISGFIITFISGTHIDIKGTSSGLYVILFSAMQYYAQPMFSGSPVTFVLACIFGAGILQIFFAFLRFGVLGDSLPSSAILGMMASLGLLLALKQVYSLVGSTLKPTQSLELILWLPAALSEGVPAIACIGIISILIMILCTYLPVSVKPFVPAPLVVIVVGVVLSEFLQLSTLEAENQTTYLLHLPSTLWDGITTPNFSHFFEWNSLGYVLIIAFAGTLETITSSKAIEMADPEKRKTRLNKDLLSIGIGNTLLSLIGGLPMSSDVKRGIINVNYGAKSSWSNFYHALILLLLFLLGNSFIQKIPMAALAGILIFFAYKLISPKQLSATYNIGTEQLVVFLSTLVISFFSNMVIGLLCGIVIELLIYLYLGISWKGIFKCNLTTQSNSPDELNISISDAAIFSNFYSLSKIIRTLPQQAQVKINFSNSTLIDHTFLEQLHYVQKKLEEQGGSLSIEGLDYHFNLSQHPLASRRVMDVTLQLKPRQEALQQYALEKSWIFEKRMLSNVEKYASFLQSKQMKIVALENSMKGMYRTLSFEFADPIVELNVNHRIQKIKMTSAYFRIDGLSLPDFTLEPDSFTSDYVFTKETGWQDINFESHPNFSYYYILTGPDETAVRNFFTPTLIELLERNKGFRIECRQQTLFIYTKARRIKPEHLDILTGFTFLFMDYLIEHRYKKQPGKYIP